MALEFEVEQLDRMIRTIEKAEASDWLSWQQVRDLLNRSRAQVVLAGKAMERADRARKAA